MNDLQPLGVPFKSKKRGKGIRKTSLPDSK